MVGCFPRFLGDKHGGANYCFDRIPEKTYSWREMVVPALCSERVDKLVWGLHRKCKKRAALSHFDEFYHSEKAFLSFGLETIMRVDYSHWHDGMMGMGNLRNAMMRLGLSRGCDGMITQHWDQRGCQIYSAACMRQVNHFDLSRTEQTKTMYQNSKKSAGTLHYS